MTKLSDACVECELDKVKEILSDRENHHLLLEKDELGCIPLHYACTMGHLGIVKTLLRFPCPQVDIFCKLGKTPFHYACVGAHAGIIRFFTTRKSASWLANLDRSLSNPLHHTSCKKRVQASRLFINKLDYPCLKAKNKDTNTPLHIACHTRNHRFVELILPRLKHKDLVIINKDGNTPLHMVCLGSNPNVSKGSKRIVELLLERLNPEDLVLRNCSGNTPLHCAISDKPRPELFKALINKLRYKDLLLENNVGDTPLHQACRYWDTHSVKVLLRTLHYDALVIKNDDGDTPLHTAIYGHNRKATRLLLQRLSPDDIAIKCSQGHTPFYASACHDNNYDCFELLLAMARIEDSLEFGRSEIPIYDCHDLMRDFKKDPMKTKLELIKKTGFLQMQVARCFSLVIGLCDDYFTFNPQTDKNDTMNRFFQISSKLPMEIQMIICNRVFESDGETVKKADLDAAICYLF